MKNLSRGDFESVENENLPNAGFESLEKNPLGVGFESLEKNSPGGGFEKEERNRR